MKTQNQHIRLWLKSGLPLTALKALKLFGCFRLSARIYDLKKQGMDIKSELVYKDGKRFAEYRLKY